MGLMFFEFATVNKIAFGPGTLSQVAPEAAKLGRKAMVIIGSDPTRARPLLRQLEKERVERETFSVSGEPNIQTIESATGLARQRKCDMAIGFGGGSVIDTAKAVAALLTNNGKLMDYLEVVGKGKALENPAAPCIAIPTTAGTGAEVTRNSVIQCDLEKVKVSLRSPHMLPNLAVVDPELCLGLPPSVTASTGMDALSQLIEPLLSPTSSPLVRALCREGIPRAARAIFPAYKKDDHKAREEMCLASLFSGLALANAKLGAVHGIAGPFGGMFKAPHGAVCGRLLAPVMRANARALEERAATDPALERLVEVAWLLTDQRGGPASAGADWVDAMCRQMDIPGLASYGLSEEHFPSLISKAQKASSMKGNPIQLTENELVQLLRESL
jgi:alcohol dehydrogenase class IV